MPRLAPVIQRRCLVNTDVLRSPRWGHVYSTCARALPDSSLSLCGLRKDCEGVLMEDLVPFLKDKLRTLPAAETGIRVDSRPSFQACSCRMSTRRSRLLKNAA